ncbi:MAG: InlB B-repeat-containing protein [Firmicutes bacterium]|nr:InlB B-repeat-containing protein [Bacillota bacterium]
MTAVDTTKKKWTYTFTDITLAGNRTVTFSATGTNNKEVKTSAHFTVIGVDAKISPASIQVGGSITCTLTTDQAVAAATARLVGRGPDGEKMQGGPTKWTHQFTDITLAGNRTVEFEVTLADGNKFTVSKGFTVTDDPLHNFVQKALDEEGYHEKKTNNLLGNITTTATPTEKTQNSGTNNWTKYGAWFGPGYNGGDAGQWCHMFVSWCANFTNPSIIDSNRSNKSPSVHLVPKASYTVDGANYFKVKGQYRNGGRYGGTYSPKEGDIIYFYSTTKQRIGHVGIVTACDGNTVYTIEGNSNNEVVRHSYSISNSRIDGYGVMGGTSNGMTSTSGASARTITMEPEPTAGDSGQLISSILNLQDNTGQAWSAILPKAWSDYLSIEVLGENQNSLRVNFIGKSKLSKGDNSAGIELFYIINEDALNDDHWDGVHELGVINGIKYYFATATDSAIGCLFDALENKGSELDKDELALLGDDCVKAKEIKSNIYEAMSGVDQIKSYMTFTFNGESLTVPAEVESNTQNGFAFRTDNAMDGTIQTTLNQTYTVTFDSQGGGHVVSQTVVDESKATKPADPIRSGYTFAGWFLDDWAYDFGAAVTSSFILDAHWTQLAHIVTFDSQGGSHVVSQTVADESNITEPADPVRPGYAFAGWFLDDWAYDFGAAVTSSFVLDAHWTQLAHIVTFDSQGGSHVASQTIADESKATKPADPVRSGYTFAGWFLDNWSYDFDAAVISDFVLTAHWTQITHIVTFDSQGGSSVPQQTVADENKATKPADPVRSGYTFAGWFLDNWAYDFGAAVTSSFILNAHWTQITHIVTFDSQGGSHVPQQIVADKNVAAKPADPVRPGYTFAGWLLDNLAYDFRAAVTSSFILNARWAHADHAATIVNAVPSASINKLNGNKNDLTIKVTENLSDGTANVITKTFSVDNNVTDVYAVGIHNVYVEIKGGTQISACYIVE